MEYERTIPSDNIQSLALVFQRLKLSSFSGMERVIAAPKFPEERGKDLLSDLENLETKMWNN